jgi:UPF0042 nucleotide-binding protein
MASRLDIIVITGLSGSGKSVAIKALEDNGFFCIDNLPAPLIPKFIELCQGYREDIKRVGFGIDLRGGQFIEGWPDVLRAIRETGHNVEVIFLDASDQLLLRRFNETRRPHPLQGGGSVLDGIARERSALETMREFADRIVDTSELNVHELRQVVESSYVRTSEKRRMTVFLISFGYKYGIPADADVIMDVRFLPNPFFVNGLRSKNGLSRDVKDFLLLREETREYLEKLRALLEFTLPKYEREGKSNLTIAFGCTGGRHRSVALVDEVQRQLSNSPWYCQVRHRDIDR